MHTPWGKALKVEQLATGFVFVETSETSGYVLADSYANQHLTPQARDKAIKYGRYYCFETGKEGSIVELELRQFWPRFLSGAPKAIQDDPYPYLLRRASYYQADYLIARRITPDPDCLRLWELRQENARLKRAGDPDLIVECEPWSTGLHDVTIVVTADGCRHMVTTKSYRQLEGLKLLSKCKAAKAARLPPVEDKATG